MIHWNEYKKYKTTALAYMANGFSENTDIYIEVLKYKLKKITKEQCVENIINLLSNGEHFKPL
jgi:hypothetical protein